MFCDSGDSLMRKTMKIQLLFPVALENYQHLHLSVQKAHAGSVL